MTLYIDTTDYNSVTFYLLGDHPELVSGSNKKKEHGFRIKSGMTHKKSFKIDPHKSHETLGKLEEFIKSVKCKVESIKKIIVNKGPGSFTGTRVGAAHALALSLAWGIPIKALDKEQFDKQIKKHSK